MNRRSRVPGRPIVNDGRPISEGGAAVLVSSFVELVRRNPHLPADSVEFRRGFAALVIAVLAESE